MISWSAQGCQAPCCRKGMLPPCWILLESWHSNSAGERLTIPTPLTLVLHGRFRSFLADVILETTIQVTVVTYSQLSTEQEVAAWVTSMETGKPVANATVFFFGGRSLVSIRPRMIHFWNDLFSVADRCGAFGRRQDGCQWRRFVGRNQNLTG